MNSKNIQNLKRFRDFDFLIRKKHASCILIYKCVNIIRQWISIVRKYSLDAVYLHIAILAHCRRIV